MSLCCKIPGHVSLLSPSFAPLCDQPRVLLPGSAALTENELTENKLMLTKGTPLFLLHESPGISCDMRFLGMDAAGV